MDECFCATRNRLVVEGEELVLQNLPDGQLGLISVNDFRRNGRTPGGSQNGTLWQRIVQCFAKVPDRSHPAQAVWLPSRTYLIVKGIASALQQRYGLQEEEGAIFLRTETQADSSPGELRFNNGAVVPLQELRTGQRLEVLSLAGTHPTLYEPDFQVRS
jgi:hypothetical protein